ncbi:MAG: M48 family metallopeptidase [Planctomycetaceae bacterium]
MLRPQNLVVRFAGLVALIQLCGLGVSDVSAQQFKLPFTDPTRMFEHAFGEDSAADRQALEKIAVTVEEERQIGKQILQSGLASLKDSGVSVDSLGKDVEYLSSLVETLKPFMKNKNRYPTIQVMVARSPKIDARSCPGGTLIFFEGLLDAAGSEAALIGIVGHELSHLDRGHQLLPIKRIKLMEKSFSSQQNLNQFLQSGPGLMKLWAKPYRPEDERDADDDGVTWSLATGYDPREMAKLFPKKVGKNSVTEAMPWATFFQSHPDNGERVKSIHARYAKWSKMNPKAEPLFIGQENLAQRVSRKQTTENKQ